MWFKIPYDVYHDYYKNSLYRLKWNPTMKMFESMNEKEHDLDENLMKYKVTFINVIYDQKNDAKEHGAMWCNEAKLWFYVGPDNDKYFEKHFRKINDDVVISLLAESI